MPSHHHGYGHGSDVCEEESEGLEKARMRKASDEWECSSLILSFSSDLSLSLSPSFLVSFSLSLSLSLSLWGSVSVCVRVCVCVCTYAASYMSINELLQY